MKTFAVLTALAMLRSTAAVSHTDGQVSASTESKFAANKDGIHISTGSESDLVFSRYTREEVSLLDLHGHVEELEGSRATEADAMKELQPALETTVTQLAQSLSEGLANVSDAQFGSVSTYTDFKDTSAAVLTATIQKSQEETAAAVAVASKSTTDTVTSSSNSLKDALTKAVNDVIATQELEAGCISQGMQYDTKAKKCGGAPHTFGGGAKKCSKDTAGHTYYDATDKALKVCNSVEYKAVGNAAKIGTKEHPARSCQQLVDRGMIPSAGAKFFLGKDPKKASEWKCFPDGGALSYGDGSDGDVDLVYSGGSNSYGGVHHYAVFIDDMFPGYDPENYYIPQYKNVRIRKSVHLKSKPGGNGGRDAIQGAGMVAFRVSGKLTIDAGAFIDQNYMGRDGGVTKFDNRAHTYPRNSQVTNTNGEGEGAGTGGMGGFDCCHGSGGGGGSFKTRGGYGYSDMCRRTKYPQHWARPGKALELKSKYFHPTEYMGSGGGAGGAGHPSNNNDYHSSCNPPSGSPGGGGIQIMAKDMLNRGRMRAEGARGIPDRRMCGWAGGNPQVGSGGAGSGGLVKLITNNAAATGAVSIGGGSRSERQNWGNCNFDGRGYKIPGGKGTVYPNAPSNQMQLGGNGGAGYLVHTKNVKY